MSTQKWFSTKGTMAASLAIVATVLAWSGEQISDLLDHATPPLLEFGSRQAGTVEDGPLYEVVETVENSIGFEKYKVSQVHFAEHRGKWLVLALMDVPNEVDNQGRQDQRAALGRWLGGLARMAHAHPNTEIWYVRVNIHAASYGIHGPGQVIRGACSLMQPGSPMERAERLCYDRAVLAYVEPGDDRLYFTPQVKWVNKMVSPSKHAKNTIPFGVPAVMLIDPNGQVHNLFHSREQRAISSPAEVSAYLASFGNPAKEGWEAGLKSTRPTFNDWMKQFRHRTGLR